ncbi:hypothetical protein QMU85_002425 [Photobacterium damselae]|uniref:hypothetical protein n=1 Tax=Photobacterium damselae TaxID=38293 RepID=UPI0029A6E0C7|nr:hypothetical protein [Photobacterium damselae]
MSDQKKDEKSIINKKLNENSDIKFESSVQDFLKFMKSNDKFLDSGLGAFHTNGHSNW